MVDLNHSETNKALMKEAVKESLLEALETANIKKTDAENGISGFSKVRKILNDIFPIALLAMFGWISLSVVEAQKDLLSMRIKLATMDNTIQTFIDKDSRKSATSALLHHSTTVNPCNGCHTRNGVVVHTLASLPNSRLMPGDLFEKKCSGCHTLDRVLATKKDTAKWKIVVSEMRNKDTNWISAKEADIVLNYITELEKHRQ